LQARYGKQQNLERLKIRKVSINKSSKRANTLFADQCEEIKEE